MLNHFSVVLGFSIFAAAATATPTLTAKDYPKYCAPTYTSVAPTDFHTNQRLNYRQPAPRSELHGLECQKLDVRSGEVLATWNFYFCEDINANNYTENEFYIPVRSWFEFHPNFKKAEFMLFPKYTKFWRQKVTVGDTSYEWVGFNFMRNYTSQMQIEFIAPWEDGHSQFKAGAYSTAAVAFDQVKMKPLEDYYRCQVY